MFIMDQMNTAQSTHPTQHPAMPAPPPSSPLPPLPLPLPEPVPEPGDGVDSGPTLISTSVAGRPFPLPLPVSEKANEAAPAPTPIPTPVAQRQLRRAMKSKKGGLRRWRVLPGKNTRKERHDEHAHSLPNVSIVEERRTRGPEEDTCRELFD